MRYFSIAIIFLLFSFVLKSQTTETPLIKWHTIQEAEELCKTAPRKIIIDFYTDWCGWCKVMDKNTFSNPNIAAYINQYYYAVKFDAESGDTITFKDSTYYSTNPEAFKQKELPKRKPSHQLAIKLLNGKLSYPTILYMDENLNPISPISGYMTPDKIEPILVFFGQDVYKQMPYEKFTEYFDQTFKDSIPKPEVVNWYTIEQAQELNKVVPKKIIIELFADYNVLSKIMHKTSFNNPEIAKYINDNYYPVAFNVLSRDTVHFNGNVFINENKEHPFHQFAVSLLQGKMNFPQAVFMSEQNALISVVPGYFPPDVFEPVLYFFKDDVFKTMQFDEYRKTFKGKVSQ